MTEHGSDEPDTPPSAGTALEGWAEHSGHATSQVDESPAARRSRERQLARGREPLRRGPFRQRSQSARSEVERPRTRASRSGAEWRRIRRLVALGLLLVAASVTLGSALRDQASPAVVVVPQGPAPASELIPAPPPRALKLASRGAVSLHLPIDAAHVTAIGYHAVGGSPGLSLDPSGKLINAGILDRIERSILGSNAASPTYYVSGGSTNSVDVGANAGTQVYAPVSGTIAGIAPYVVNGRAWGAVITVQPTSDPTVVVAISHITPDPALRVGLAIATDPSTLLGTVADLSPVLQMDLARYTGDAGNHVHLEVRPAEVLPIP